MHSRKVMALAFLFILARVSLADDSRIFKQKPEVMPTSGQAEGTVKEKPKGAGMDKGPVPLWIWGKDNNTNYLLTKEFQTSAKKGVLRATCDNRMVVRVNGKTVAQSDEWKSPVETDISPHLISGNNKIEAAVQNEGAQAGFLLKLVLTTADGKSTAVISDQTWKATPTQGKQAENVKRIGKLGDAPWGDVFSGAPGNDLGKFNLLPGFQVEKLFTVPKDQLGSWVCITVDPKGRIIASDQNGKGLCRITPPAIGSMEETRVEHLPVKITAAQGLLFAFGSLYASVNGGPGSGLYRIRDTNGDDQFDEVVKLKALQGGGEHGPHALRLSPDGKSILVMCGNHTKPPENFQASRVPKNWGEDHLLPRMWDANGHARGIMAPGGYIARTDPEGKEWEMISIGYRNAYDFGINTVGELFAYDADMEWDMGSPWYRPTRVNHAPSGSDLGWRSGSGKWPSYYLDSLPGMVDIGPGSPVGVEFGTGAKFPAKYQKALFICDWTFGTMYAIHMEPDGSSYKGVKEEFVSRTPLPLTDAAVGKDGALYFSSGGRGTQSELFRVTYIGKDDTAPVSAQEDSGAKSRLLRKKLEEFHQPGEIQASQLDFIWTHLGHSDRYIRYAARVALEHQPVASWQDRVFKETGTETLLTASVALARQGVPSLQSALVNSLNKLEFSSLSLEQQLEWLRVYQVAFIRMGQPGKADLEKVTQKLDALFPSQHHSLNQELVNLLVYLQSPQIARKVTALLVQPSPPLDQKSIDDLLSRNRGYGQTIARILANSPDLQKLHYLFAMRNLKNHWTLEHRKVYFTTLNEMRTKSGGASYQGFLNLIEKDAFDNATDADRLAIEALGLRKPFQVKALPKAIGPGKEWKLAELVQASEGKLKGRNFKNGEKMFAAARCVVCHRFNGDGGATGPDLTQAAGRFTLKDLCESIVEPNKVISDQYRASIIETKTGQTITGKIVSENQEAIIVVTDPEDSTKVRELKKTAIEQVIPAPVSLMPGNLLLTLNDTEVWDLLAYLLSRGDPASPYFRN
ncbi:MAG: c-type cytochrome [Gemmataceae bacterium]|nr:c-type cytochrome [Gemmataceae bacterium]